MADSAGDPVVGATLAGYRIERKLGRGGMSVVYLAEDLALGRKVALKVLAPELSDDQTFRERFRLESRLAASIDHPNVIPIYEAGEAEGQFYIAMRYVDGTDLRRLLDEAGALGPTRAVELVARVADGLDAAHERGLVHRDVKPSNVLIASPGEQEHVYLADFGLTKTAETEEEAREAAQLSGTTDYVAPELITEGSSGRAADVYALGCVLYETLTGRVPFPRSSELETLVAHIDEPAPKPSEARPELPGGLDAVVERAMAKDPDERYATGRELIDAARVALPVAKVGPFGTRVRRALLAALSVLLAAGLFAAFLITRNKERSATEPTLALASGALQRVDAKTNKLVATIRVGGAPVEVAAGSGAVWLVDSRRNSLLRVDPDTYGVTTQGSGVGALAVVGTDPAFPSWVGTAADGPTGAVLSRIAAPNLNTVEASILRNLPGRPGDPAPAVVSAVGGIATTISAGWLVDLAAGTVTRLGRIPPAPRVTIETRGVAVDLAAAGRREIWLAQRRDGRGRPPGRAVRIDEQGKVTANIPLPFAPSAIATGKEGVWIADPDGGKVWRVDPNTGRTTPVRVGSRPLDLTVGAGSVWVVSGGRGMLVRIDPRTLALVATTEIGANPSALAFGQNGLWVAVAGGRPKSVADFPKRYRGLGYETESVHPATFREPCAEGLPSRDCLVVVTGRLTGEGGASASVRFAWREKRHRGGTVVCQGKRRTDPVSSDVRGDAGTGRLEIAGWGTVALNLDRTVYTFSSMIFPGGDLCGQQSGTWVGVRGAIRGMAGTFTTRGPYNTLVLQD